MTYDEYTTLKKGDDLKNKDKRFKFLHFAKKNGNIITLRDNKRQVFSKEYCINYFDKT